MIVPQNRLLYWTAFVLLPASLVAVAVPANGATVAGVIGAFVALVAVDAVRATKRLRSVRVELPALVRLAKDRPGAIEVRIASTAEDPPRLQLGLALPREIVSAHEQLLVAVDQRTPDSRVAWPCVPSQRGNYLLRHCYVEGSSPFGFWGVRKAQPSHCEIRVYPNLLPERKNLAALFLHRGHIGIHAQRQVGKGRDFEKLRDYLAGDSIDDIHWKATAKRGHPVTKVFQIERTQEVYVVIDASRLSARLTGPGTTMLERFVTTALLLGLVAQQQGDLFGLLAFSDRVQRFVRAKSGRGHFSGCRDALYTLQPESESPNYDELCTFLRLRLRRRALLVILTSLDDPVLAESFVRNAELIGRHHLVLVNMLRPASAQPLFSNPMTDSVDAIYERLGGHIEWHNLRELGKVLQRQGVQFSQLENETMATALVTQYMTVKQKQLL